MVAILIFAIIFCQNPIWPLWHLGNILSWIFVILLLIKKRTAIINHKYGIGIILSVFILLVAYIIIPLRTGFMFSNVIYILTFIITFSISPVDYRKALLYISKTLGIIICISLPLWIFQTYVYPILPLYSSIDITSMKSAEEEITMNNYFFFVTYFDHTIFPRFYSMFDEPGVLGTLSTFILFGNRYDFKKWYNIVILLGGIFTFSLAFYALTTIGFLFQRLKTFRNIMPTLAIAVVCFFLLQYLANNDEGFQSSIISRIADGTEQSLNHRTGDAANRVFDNILWTEDFFFGLGDKAITANLMEGQSWKLYIVHRGFIAVLALLFCYMQFTKRNLDCIFFYILFFISFLQRPFAFYSWQMLLFCCVVAELMATKQSIIRNSTTGKKIMRYNNT